MIKSGVGEMAWMVVVLPMLRAMGEQVVEFEFVEFPCTRERILVL